MSKDSAGRQGSLRSANRRAEQFKQPLFIHLCFRVHEVVEVLCACPHLELLEVRPLPPGGVPIWSSLSYFCQFLEHLAVTLSLHICNQFLEHPAAIFSLHLQSVPGTSRGYLFFAPAISSWDIPRLSLLYTCNQFLVAVCISNSCLLLPNPYIGLNINLNKQYPSP